MHITFNFSSDAAVYGIVVILFCFNDFVFYWIISKLQYMLGV